MAEEKIMRINLRRELLKVPNWKRKAKFVGFLRKKLKNPDLVVDPKLNEKIWASDSLTVRLKLVKEDKVIKATIVE